MTLYQLKKRAADRDLIVRKDGHGNFMLVDIHTGGVAAFPAQMTLEEIENWLDDLDAQTRIEELKILANKERRNYETR